MLIGTFAPADGWAGKTVEYDEASEAFTIQDHGPVAAHQVLKFAAVGHLEWASEEARTLVESRQSSEEAAAHRRAAEVAQRAAQLAAEEAAASGRGQEPEGEAQATTPTDSASQTSVRVRGLWCYVLASSRAPLRTLTKPAWDLDFRADELVILRGNREAERLPYPEISRLEVVGPEAETDSDCFVLGEGAPLMSSEVRAQWTQQVHKPAGIFLEANSVSYVYATETETAHEVQARLRPVFATLRTVHHAGNGSTTGADAGHMIEQLERLARLHETDALSDAEFAALKAKLME